MGLDNLIIAASVLTALSVAAVLLLAFIYALDDIAFVRRRCPICRRFGCIQSRDTEMFGVTESCDSVRICGNCEGRSIRQQNRWIAHPPGNPIVAKWSRERSFYVIRPIKSFWLATRQQLPTLHIDDAESSGEILNNAVEPCDAPKSPVDRNFES